MNPSDRRQHKRLRLDRSVRIHVHLFPVMPFIGEAVEATLINISEGGMAVQLEQSASEKKIKNRARTKIHFRFPGRPLRECAAVVHHCFALADGSHFVGIRFLKAPSALRREIREMIQDNQSCNRRIEEQFAPWCDISCSFHNLCRKPLRMTHEISRPFQHMEIAFQAAD